MLDISRKTSTLRTAIAEATIAMNPETVQRALSGDTPKGSPLEVAKVAAVQAAKNTSAIIPYCHPLPVDFVGVDYTHTETTIKIIVTVKAIYKTGVEMEALTAASVAALTIYDMLKMLDESMEIQGVRLRSKTGGKSDFAEQLRTPLRAGVLVMSDSISSGKKTDRSGNIIVNRLRAAEVNVQEYLVIPDDPAMISQIVRNWCDQREFDLVVTTGGTGFSPRDRTPEAMRDVIEIEVPGIAEAIRAHGQARTPYSMLSRSLAGIRRETIIICLPGSTRGVEESLDAIMPALNHSFRMLWAGGHARKSLSEDEA